MLRAEVVEGSARNILRMAAGSAGHTVTCIHAMQIKID